MMDYQGRHPIFNAATIRTGPLRARRNKVHLADLVTPDRLPSPVRIGPSALSSIDALANSVHQARRAGAPVIVFTGAHLVKNGLAPLLGDLIERGLVTHVAGNVATIIHDVELALIGETSEDVPNALTAGAFGMAAEFSYINEAIRLGNRRKWGFGESMAALVTDPAFLAEVLDAAVTCPDSPREFAHPDISLVAATRRAGIPLTVHAGIGTDVIDQHPSFDGEAKGGCSGRDFLIFVEAVKQLRAGGVFINIGSAVQGPEVLLKAVSMAANVGCQPQGIVTADLDLRPMDPAAMQDEAAPGYYCRDLKSIVTRIPQAFGGSGVYIQGDQKQTVPALYTALTRA